MFSGDIVQFGIPVVENTGNSEKVNKKNDRAHKINDLGIIPG